MNKESVEISIIVPLYNAGEHLSPCLDSILHQSFGAWELIIVSDCPTDNSDLVAQRHAQQDKRIHILSNEHNLHIGNSRNIGMLNATGKYLCFIDHDDICHQRMLLDLYNKIEETHADIVFSNTSQDLHSNAHLGNINCRDEILHRILSARDNAFNQIHGCLYKRELIDMHQIQFVDTNLISGEDVLFNIEALYFSKHVTYLDRTYYTHYNHQSSFGIKRHYFMPSMRKGMIIHLREFASKNLWNQKLLNLLDERIVRTYNHMFLRLIFWHEYTTLWHELRLAGKEYYVRKSYLSFEEKSTKVHYTIIYKLTRGYMRIAALWE